MVPLPELITTATATATTTTMTTVAKSLLIYDDIQPLCQYPCNAPPHPLLLPPFPHGPPLKVELPPPPPPPPLLDNHDIFTQLGDPNFFAVFGSGGSSGMAHFPFAPPGGEGESGGSCGRQESGDPMMMAPDTFIDDFPMDMFDHIEPLPSPSEW